MELQNTTYGNLANESRFATEYFRFCHYSAHERLLFLLTLIEKHLFTAKPPYTQSKSTCFTPIINQSYKTISNNYLYYITGLSSKVENAQQISEFVRDLKYA
jgi:hypothetical protein